MFIDNQLNYIIKMPLLLFLLRSLTGFNSEIPSPRQIARPRLEIPVCPTIYPELGVGENNSIHTFPKDISAMLNAISVVHDLNSCQRVHFL